MPTDELKELEEQLSGLSHSEEAIAAIRKFSENLGNTQARLAVFNATRALVRSPILQQEAEALGFSGDAFTILQGDVVVTESAFHLGERIVGYPKYVVLNSSCDLIPGRREYAALLKVVEIRDDLTGVFCTSRTERLGTERNREDAQEGVHTRADCREVAAD